MVSVLEFAMFIVIIYFLYDIRRRQGVSQKSKERILSITVLDTSALIDGRFLHIVELRVLVGTFVVPTAVLAELQKLADLKGPFERKRALAGLQNLKKLSEINHVDFRIEEQDSKDSQEADVQVIEVALRYNARICTNDVALQRRAEAQHCVVINMNELAEAIKLKLRAHDVLPLRIVAKGESRSQGVGYTDDGVMIVVEQASHLIGRTVLVEIRKTLETTTGQTAFAKIKQPT